MARQFIKIKQGDADTFTETITGLDSLSGYSAKMYIYNKDETELDTIAGSIDGLYIQLLGHALKRFNAFIDDNDIFILSAQAASDVVAHLTGSDNDNLHVSLLLTWHYLVSGCRS